MSVVNEIIKDIPIPRMLKVQQEFSRNRIESVSDEVQRQLNQEKIKKLISPGMKIAITAGSRGIYKQAEILREIVAFLRSLGAEPYIVAAMGSHGGATVEGQQEILSGYGITESYCKCPVKVGERCTKIGNTEDGRPVYIDCYAAEADGIVVVNRIKPHTAFRGSYESGLMKMMAIGLGKQKGAETCHAAGFEHMAEMIPKFGNSVLKYANVIFGLAILENAYDETCELHALTKEEIPTEEPVLLKKARSYMPRILVGPADVLIVAQIGKNFSGDGMDPNISGTFATKCASGGMTSQRVAVLDISDESHGNGVGFGMADVSTKRAYAKYDFDMSYPNALTCLVSQVVKVPMILDNDRHCIQAAIKLCANIDYNKARLVYIRNTLQLSEIFISENMRAQAEAVAGVTVGKKAFEMKFDEQGNLDFF